MGYNQYQDDDDYVSPHHSSKRKRERQTTEDFSVYGNASNKKCRQCAFKNECDQSNAQRCKRFRKSRTNDEWDY